jgi:hypothetical protein
VISHRHEGVRVAVDFAPGLLNGSGLLTIDPKSLQRRPAAYGITGHPVFVVSVRNVGRLPARVSSVRLHTDGLSLQTQAMPASPPLPSTVEVSDSKTWCFDGVDAAALVSAAQTQRHDADRLFAEVRLGSGVSRRSVRISFVRSSSALGQIQSS